MQPAAHPHPVRKVHTGEVSAISKYVASGGSLFLVIDQNMWSTLEQTNVNDLIRPFGIQLGDEGPDSLAGGHTKAGLITDKRLKISYHGARTVTGGTPFSFNDRCPLETPRPPLAPPPPPPPVLGQLEAAGSRPDRLESRPPEGGGFRPGTLD